MGGANVICGKGAKKGNCGIAERGFDLCAAALFAVDQAEDAGDVHAGFAGGFDGGDGGAAGGADVVDDDDVGSGMEEALDLAAGAVGLLGFADEEAVDERWRDGGIFAQVLIEVFVGDHGGELCVIVNGPGAGGGGVGDERVGAHGESAYGLDGLGVRDVLADEVVEDEAGEAAAFGVQRGDAAVDVVVGLLAAGEGEVAELEGVGGDED